MAVQIPSATDDDRALALRFERGEPGAFAVVVECYADRIGRLASRLLAWREGADDVAQEVLLSALRQQSRFRARSGLWPWLATMTVNRCRSLQRRQWIAQRVLGRWAISRTEFAGPAGEAVVRDETAVVVREAVERLPGRSREVIVLRYLEELSLEQVAEILGVRKNTVEVRISRAKRQLETLLRPLVGE